MSKNLVTSDSVNDSQETTELSDNLVLLGKLCTPNATKLSLWMNLWVNFHLAQSRDENEVSFTRYLRFGPPKIERNMFFLFLRSNILTTNFKVVTKVGAQKDFDERINLLQLL